MQSTEQDIAVINALVTQFYDVVPLEYRTYCALTSRISAAVLAHFGIEARLVPCQMWLATPDNNYVVGFLGKTSEQPRWDGHVVCRSGHVIIDAALKNFERDFGLNVPNIGAISCFDVPAQVISRYDLTADSRIWWHYPPDSPGLDISIPEELPEVVERYAAQLVRRMSDTLPASLRRESPEGHAPIPSP